MGFVGGIWLLWNDQMVSVEVVSMRDQFITTLVRELGGKCWLLTVVYASPKALVRDELWLYLQQLGRVVDIPWVVIGDVN